MSSPRTKQTSFLDLPAELRNDIYHLALTHDTVTVTDRLIEPALLSTTRQIRRETLPIFYGANTFEAPYPPFMMDLSADKISMLRAVRAVHPSFAVKLQGRASHRSIEGIAKNVGYIRERVYRLVEVHGKGSLKRDVLLVPLMPGVAGERIEWMTLAELERRLVLAAELRLVADREA
ncbi:hypothetical protein LTR36_003845 [Oleoguttula mirabilis]|uniref:Uncharacterized protein n=1 Tax=Oleoguttula mirabilis TaxID=1507867 RepID=A0AAV9JK86_9PEZI|nr:hypothetical protein LTR36_003845 [Oleoguttula mirabilis]